MIVRDYDVLYRCRACAVLFSNQTIHRRGEPKEAIKELYDRESIFSVARVIVHHCTVDPGRPELIGLADFAGLERA